MNNLKSLSIDVVNTVAEFLILTFGKTTSLDVKNNLRKLGFSATQAEVSKYLQDIQEFRKENYKYELDGSEVGMRVETKSEGWKSFRVYSFDTVSDDTSVQTSTTPAPAIRATGNVKDYIARNMNENSSSIADKFGISTRSVAAYKANINR